jgi:prolyl oligopeptidase
MRHSRYSCFDSAPRARALLAAAVLAMGGIRALAADLPALAPATPVTETIFGEKVTDPYRYMEDLSSPQVQQWARAQAAYARAVLDAIPGRVPLLARIAELEASVQARVRNVKRMPNGDYFFEKRGADDNQFKLYVRHGLHGREQLLVDPEALTKQTGTPHAINFYRPFDSGRYVAYGMSQGGSEEASIHVIETATLKQVINPIDRAHYSDAAWMPDDSGFFFFRQRQLPAGTPDTEKYRGQTAYFHRLKGGAADQPLIVAGTADRIAIAAEEFPIIQPVQATPYVVAIPANGVQSELDLYVAPRAEVLSPKVRWRKLFGRESDITGFAIHGDDLYLLSHHDAPRFKVLKTSVTHPNIANAQVVIAPGREVVTAIAAAKDALYVQARDGTAGKLYRVAYTKGAATDLLTLPQQGAVDIAASDARLPGVLVSIGSWMRDVGYYAPGPDGRFVDTGLQPVGPNGAPGSLESKEVMVKSHDGVEVPLSIVYTKGTRLDGTNPTELYGYGAYGITNDPVYVPGFLAWYERGGIRATCHVRGGGAYGEEWHLAGKQATKSNTWKDFIACGEYLVREGYTSPARLAIHGGSAGGILIGRAMTERPDLWAVAVPEVGVLNALRAEFSANGVPNIPEFGSIRDEKQFRALLEMDALQHVTDGTKYPATLLIHGINDPRVPPWQSMKMAARLQAANASGKPVLLRIDYSGGHGIGNTKTQRQESYTPISGVSCSGSSASPLFSRRHTLANLTRGDDA